MNAYASLRVLLIVAAVSFAFVLYGSSAMAQDVGGDIGGAGIFRPKNPETKKRTTKPTPVVKSGTKSGSRTKPAGPSVEDWIEDLLDKGNGFRDARRFSEAEEAYKSVFKLNPTDARAAYGLGNVYSDQQRWENAEKAYRNAVEWSPKNVDALVALSVVLVQPGTAGDNAKRFADAENAARRAVQLDPSNAIA